VNSGIDALTKEIQVLASLAAQEGPRRELWTTYALFPAAPLPPFLFSI
jgi:hypothetical protein